MIKKKLRKEKKTILFPSHRKVFIIKILITFIIKVKYFKKKNLLEIEINVFPGIIIKCILNLSLHV